MREALWKPVDVAKVRGRSGFLRSPDYEVFLSGRGPGGQSPCGRRGFCRVARCVCAGFGRFFHRHIIQVSTSSASNSDFHTGTFRRVPTRTTRSCLVCLAECRCTTRGTITSAETVVGPNDLGGGAIEWWITGTYGVGTAVCRSRMGQCERADPADITNMFRLTKSGARPKTRRWARGEWAATSRGS